MNIKDCKVLSIKKHSFCYSNLNFPNGETNRLAEFLSNIFVSQHRKGSRWYLHFYYLLSVINTYDLSSRCSIIFFIFFKIPFLRTGGVVNVQAIPIIVVFFRQLLLVKIKMEW